MTILHVDLRALSGVDTETINLTTASIDLAPYRPYHVEDGPDDYLVDNKILKVRLATGVADIDLPPTPAGNALKIQIRSVRGLGTPWLVSIPASGTVNLGDLPHLDPATLDPDVEPEAAWAASLTAEQQARIDADADLQAQIDAGGGGGPITSSQITDSTAPGRALLTAESTTVQRSALGLGNVQNLAPADLPISSAQSAVNALKADLVSGLVPASQLPSYVDDVLSFANLAGFPATGEDGKIYVAKDTNLTYRWTGSTYSVLDPSLALGETSSTAYRGDRGKVAYDHSQTTGNPHGTTATDLGLAAVATTGAYNDLSGKPTIPASGSWQKVIDLPLTTLTGWTPGAGTWTASASGINQSVTTTGTVRRNWYNAALDQSEFIIECEMMMGTSTTATSRIGLNVGGPTTDTTGADAFVFQTTDTTTGLKLLHQEKDALNNGVDITLSSPITLGTWVKLRLHKSGTDYGVTVNNTFIGMVRAQILDGVTGSSTSRNMSRIGLHSNSGDATFRNLKVWTPSDAGTSDPVGSPVASVNGQTGVVALVATDVGAAPTSHTHTASQISDSTTAGRTLLTAADLAAQKSTLQIGNVNNTLDVNKAVLSATKLTNARNINGVSFDGTANITVADATKQPLDSDLTAIAALAPADGQVLSWSTTLGAWTVANQTGNSEQAYAENVTGTVTTATAAGTFGAFVSIPGTTINVTSSGGRPVTIQFDGIFTQTVTGSGTAYLTLVETTTGNTGYRKSAYKPLPNTTDASMSTGDWFGRWHLGVVTTTRTFVLQTVLYAAASNSPTITVVNSAGNPTTISALLG